MQVPKYFKIHYEQQHQLVTSQNCIELYENLDDLAIKSPYTYNIQV